MHIEMAHKNPPAGRENCLENSDDYANAIKQTHSTRATSQFVTQLNLKINRAEAVPSSEPEMPW